MKFDIVTIFPGMVGAGLAVVGVTVLLACYVSTRGAGRAPFVYQGF